MTKKIITVFGATGAQGGGLAHAILADKDSEFALRAVTRKPDSEAAKALAAAGAQIAVADMDDAASVLRALEGAFGAFCVTNFWEHFSPDEGTGAGQGDGRRRSRRRAEHVIWSTLEDTRAFLPADGKRMPVLMGKYNAAFDAKGEANKFFTVRAPTTLVNTSFYWDNLINFGMAPKKGPTACWLSRCRWATRSCPASSPRTSANAPTASSRRHSERRQDFRDCRRAPDRSADGRRFDQGPRADGAVQRGHA
jgi:hypothetical protein